MSSTRNRGSQKRVFHCIIKDEDLYFSAEVSVVRLARPFPSKHDKGEFEFADIFIVDLPNRIGLRGVSFTQDASGELVAASFDELPPFHDHFVLFDLYGRGKYLQRNEFKNKENARAMTILGWGDSVRRVWPIHSRLQWPFPAAISPDQLEAFHLRFSR